MDLKIKVGTHYGNAEKIFIVVKEITDEPELARTAYAYDHLCNGFEELFDEYHPSIRKDDSICETLQKLNSMMDCKEIGLVAAASVLDNLARAINKVSPDYLRPTTGKFMDFNGSVKYCPWEAQAIGLAEKVVDKVNEEFVYKGMGADDALELGLKALPFMTHSARSLMLWNANIGPAIGTIMEERDDALKGQKRAAV